MTTILYILMRYGMVVEMFLRLFDDVYIVTNIPVSQLITMYLVLLVYVLQR